MNKLNLPDIPDLTAAPSDELNERTLAAMRAASPRKTAKKNPAPEADHRLRGTVLHGTGADGRGSSSV